MPDQHAYWSSTGDVSAPCRICDKPVTDPIHFAKGAP